MSTTSTTKRRTSSYSSQTGVAAKKWLRLLGEDPIISTRNQLESFHERYAQERAKRIRPEGRGQYIDVTYSDKHKSFADDIWTEPDHPPQRLRLVNGSHTRMLVIGGGYGGLSFAVRSIQAGFDPKDIVIVESAGGFGGTWYWNRYPGLMCDVESYIYMPLLEETGYVPKHKYSYGPELREHADRIARHWNLHTRGAFQQEAERLEWSEESKCWQVQILDLLTQEYVCITADFVHVCPGILVRPKVVNMPGVENFQGKSFHTSRWDYDYTGGSPDDPSLINLKDKRVGIIGTGASATGTIPYLAQWAKELYVFQRTPALVSPRGQTATDLDLYQKSVQTHPGWQITRNQNFNTFTTATNKPTDKDLVKDGWSTLPQLAAFNGTTKSITPSTLPSHITTLRTQDLKTTLQSHSLVDTTIRNTQTASNLKAWYPTWCKRPTFTDTYLPAFNRPNVHLIDTSGQGIDSITDHGILANNTHYPLDCIVHGTGFSLEKDVSAPRRAGITTIGRNGVSLDEKWAQGPATLHGLMTNGFPNLFFAGPTQASTSVNFLSATDELARHAAQILSSAFSGTATGIRRGKVLIEPTIEVEEEWAERLVETGIAFGALAGCTPSYFNHEGEVLDVEGRRRAARSGMWGRGANDFADVLKDWREGGMEGLIVNFEGEEV